MTEHDMPNTVSLAYLQALFDYTRGRGLDDVRLLGGTPLNLRDGEARCTEAFAARLFEEAAVLLEDGTLGLHVGETIRPGHYGVLGYVLMNCATLGEALDYLLRYQTLVIALKGGFGILAEEECLVVCSPPDEEWPMRQLAEFNLAACISFMRWVTGHHGSPQRIDFNYPAPPDLAEYRRLFGCELRFDQPCYRLVLPLAWLRMPLIRPDAGMRAAMLRLAEQQLLSLPRGDDVLSNARSVIARGLSEGPVDLAGVAERLSIGARTLQRALQANGSSFSGLIDDVRQELAKRYLADTTLTVIDAAFLLGFSEQSAFQRAFKRWTGLTPGDYRRRLPAAGSPWDNA
ncbi:MAG: AraC family transcriptional regulator [Moraxellaceae bacterium]|nr:AraC family transcriptional regulator [Moraxellaceae bacterium]